jgi:hypothetical protein
MELSIIIGVAVVAFAAGYLVKRNNARVKGIDDFIDKIDDGLEDKIKEKIKKKLDK